MNNINECETHSKFGELDHSDPNCSRIRFMDDAKTEKTEPEAKILHPNTSENTRCFINAMPDGQKEAFTKSHSDDILRALLG